MKFDSKIEKECWERLITIFDRKCIDVHPVIEECWFEQSGKSKADFRLAKEDLYIEVKGLMTLFEVNKMRYLQHLLKRNYYILQCTAESWLQPFEESEKMRKDREEILRNNVDAQFAELQDLKDGRVSAAELSKRSQQRLENYILHRQGDFSRWSEVYKRKTGKELW